MGAFSGDMIHSHSTLDEITPSPAPPGSEPPTPPPSLPFRRPADYYSTPVGEARALFPRWVPFGCGTASILVLIVVFILGAIAARGGLGIAVEMVFGTMQGEIDKMFTPDVKPTDKAAFDAEMKALRDSVRQNRVRMDRLQPLLRTIREVSADEKVTPAEAQQLTREIHGINARK